MQRQEINISLACSCKVGEKWLCSRIYSRITRNRPAWLGLLDLFIVGGQCHAHSCMSPESWVVVLLWSCVDVSELGHIWSRKWRIAWSVPRYYLKRCWFICIGIEVNRFKRNNNKKQKMHLEMSVKWRPVCSSLIVLIYHVSYVCKWFKCWF